MDGSSRRIHGCALACRKKAHGLILPLGASEKKESGLELLCHLSYSGGTMAQLRHQRQVELMSGWQPPFSRNRLVLRKKKIPVVVIEPDPLIRALVMRWVGEAGYLAIDPENTPPAARLSPQLVIADISDPNYASASIELLRAAYSVPILALSTRFRRGLGGSTETAERLEVCGVLPKPFTRAELLTAVVAALNCG
jgi:CheY-like chemotaxis protein